MKEKRFQNLSLALNAVLLIALFATRAELVDKQTILKSKLDDIAYRLSDMDDQITNLSAKQREQTEDLSDFSFEPTGLDPESHTLQADMSITLRRWTADTEVTLLVTQSGRITEQPMSGSGGVFTTPVSLPVEDTGEVSFAANITAGGQTSREEVTSYSDLAMLLPLTNDGSGYGDPTYRGGSLQLQYDLGVRKQYGTEVVAPGFSGAEKRRDRPDPSGKDFGVYRQQRSRCGLLYPGFGEWRHRGLLSAGGHRGAALALPG